MRQTHSPHILVVGGGSGGHVTPIVAVLEALEEKAASIQISWIAPRGDSFVSQFAGDAIKTHYIFAGKLRRYKGWEWWRYIKNFQVVLRNIRDLLLVFVGFVQTLFILIRNRPDVCFNKGGFVGLPVGLACGLLRIPFILHDSDTVPGLANLLIAPFANHITTGFPTKGFKKQHRVIHVGIPIRSSFYDGLKHIKSDDSVHAKPLLFITGGSLGAQRLNDIVTKTLDKLLESFEIIHVVGAENISQFSSRAGYQVLPFVTDKYAYYLKTAAIVVVRGGSTSVAEVAAAGSPCVVVPNSYLFDQVSNAKLLSEKKAAVVVDQLAAAEEPKLFSEPILSLYHNKKQQIESQAALKAIFPQDASYRIAQLLLPYLV